MQKVARHVAGLGRLPDEVAPTATARRREHRRAGHRRRGGGARRCAAAYAKAFTRADLGRRRGAAPGRLSSRFGSAIPAVDSAVQVELGTTAAGIYPEGVLLVRQNEAIVATPRALILATGAHDGVLLFPGNDLPGVMSARAAAMLARGGIVLGDRIALIGQGAYAAALVEHLQPSGVQILTAPAPSLVAAHGRARVTGVSLRNPRRDRVAQTTSRRRPGDRRPRRPIVRTGAAGWRVHQVRGERRGVLADNRCSRTRGECTLVHRRPARGGRGSQEILEEQAEAIAHDVAEMLANRLEPYLASCRVIPR